MNTPPNPLLSSSSSKLEPKSGLTINFNPANLPSGPSLLPPPIVPSPVPSVAKSSESQQRNPPPNQVSGVPPPMPMPPLAPTSISRPSGQLRSRYVLPPQLSQSSMSTSVPQMAENLPDPPTPTPSQPETSFSTMSFPPTSSEKIQQPPESLASQPSKSSFSGMIVLPTPSYFDIAHPNESPQQTTDAFPSNLPTMTVLPTPSYYDHSGSNLTQQDKLKSVNEATPKGIYEPPLAHWFYSTKTVHHGIIWWPFSRADAQKLEAAATDANLLSVSELPVNAPNVSVPVRGGLYDVLLRDRVYKPVYWPADEEEAGEIRRVTWLYRPQSEQRVLPCSEAMCEKLERHYRRILETNTWGDQFSVPDEDAPSGKCACIFHNPKLMLQYHKESESSSETYSDCSYLHRGLRDDLAAQLPTSDERPIEHVVFVVHGIGSIYNIRGEGLISCVNDMRKTASDLLDSHFKDKPHHDRVEFLPVRWHSSLHSEEVGVCNRLKRVTLRSIPKLRGYTNETLTDILFYTSPKYCQHIVDTVAATMKQLREIFLQRNPDYKGDFSVAGHSLGAVIVFDLLSHQRRTPSSTPSVKSTSGVPGGNGNPEDEDDWSLVDSNSTVGNGVNNNCDLVNHLRISTELSDEQIRQVVSALSSANKSLEVRTLSGGLGLPVVNYPQLGFAFNTCFLLGSPLALFLVVRGVEHLSAEFRLPTCQGCVNIFHPFDPVAYRLENLVMPEYRPCAVLMPHHAGRKRLHLELKDSIARVGADITSKVYQSLRSTWHTLQEFASAHTSSTTQKSSAGQESGSEGEEESEAIKRILSRLADNIETKSKDRESDYDYDDDECENDKDSFPCQLNQGRRLDYVLQEAPLESLNDYLFALTSHAVYWDSQDCLLFMLNQIFDNSESIGIGSAEAPTSVTSLTPRGSTNHDFSATTSLNDVIQHSASIPIFSNSLPGSAFPNVQHFYPPSQTPIFDPSPAPSTTSLQSQGTVSQPTADLNDSSVPPRQTVTAGTEDPRFVEISLAP
ncbi:hypothetical protein Aperf_G00000022239 [Anoplocephala perfoliata]